MVEEVEVLRPEEQARALSEMKLAAQGKIGLVDGESTEVVARQVALLAWRGGVKAVGFSVLPPGSPGAGR